MYSMLSIAMTRAMTTMNLVMASRASAGSRSSRSRSTSSSSMYLATSMMATEMTTRLTDLSSSDWIAGIVENAAPAVHKEERTSATETAHMASDASVRMAFENQPKTRTR